MKKFLSILILIIIFTLPISAFAKTDINGCVLFCLESEYAYDGYEVKNTNTYPFMYKNQSYVPVRFVVESLGGKITRYDDSYIIAEYDGREFSVNLSNAKVYSGVTYFPVKKLSELMGVYLYWNDGLVTISKQQLNAIGFNEEQDLKFMLGFVTYTDRYNKEYELYSNSVMYKDDSEFVIINGKVRKLENKVFYLEEKLYVPLEKTVSELGGKAAVLDSDGNYSLKYNYKNYYFPSSYVVYRDGKAYSDIEKIASYMKLKTKDHGRFVEITGIDKVYSEDEINAFRGAFETGTIEKEVKDTVLFSSDGGLYTKEFYLTLSADPESVIYYTTDGSDPTEKSNVYTGGILIKDRSEEPDKLSSVTSVVESGYKKPLANSFKGTVIKARAIKKDGTRGPVTQNTYFVSADIYTRYTGAKIISVATDEDNLFGENGIYRYPNYLTLGNPNEVSGYAEIYTNSGEKLVSQSVGIRLNGAGTRVLQQKSLRLYARQNPEYENGSLKSFKADIFDGKVKDISGEPIYKFKRLILRNAGDDWTKYYLRDTLSQEICEKLGLIYQGYTPSVVFINGEYWGVYLIRERYDSHYFEEHFKLSDDKDAVLIEIANDPLKATLSEGEQSDLEVFNAQAYFIINNDMSEKENYEIAQKYFDLDNMINLYIANIFTENVDWPHNNIKIWRNKNPENTTVDTKWRFILTDMDCTMESLKTIYYDAYLPGDERRSYWNEGRGGTLEFKLKADCLSNLMFNSLLKNEEFKNKFISRYFECIDGPLKGENIVKSIESRYKETIYLRTEHILRYPGSWKYDDTEALKKWALNRGKVAKQETNNYFGL